MSEPAKQAAPIVYLLGWPGVGKLTVAEELSRRTGWRVLDSHRIYFPIFYAVGATGETPLPPGTRDLTAQVRAAVLEAVQELAPSELGFVFTNALADRREDREMFAQLEAVAAARGAPFLPVLLTADETVLRQRVTSENRSERLKPRTGEVLDRYFAAYIQLVPEHPGLLQIDTTTLAPQQTADLILSRLNQMSQSEASPSRSTSSPRS